MRDASLTKTALRVEIQRRLQELLAQDFQRAGLLVASRVEHWLGVNPTLLHKRRVALFKSLKDELVTAYLAELFAKLSIEVCYPAFDENGIMHFASDLTQQNIYTTSDLDLIFVPGQAFDTAGHRLGRGLGCYDRALAAPLSAFPNNPLLIGLALDMQVVDKVPTECHDVRMHFICCPALGLLKTSE